MSTVTLRAGPGGKAPASGHCEAHERLVSGLRAIFLQRRGGYIQTWGRPCEVRWRLPVRGEPTHSTFSVCPPLGGISRTMFGRVGTTGSLRGRPLTGSSSPQTFAKASEQCVSSGSEWGRILPPSKCANSVSSGGWHAMYNQMELSGDRKPDQTHRKPDMQGRLKTHPLS